MASDDCIFGKSKTLETLSNAINPNSPLQQDLALAATAIDTYLTTGEGLEGLEFAKDQGFLRPNQQTKKLILASSEDTLKALMDGAQNPHGIISQFDTVPEVLDRGHKQQIQLIGAMHAMAHNGDMDGFGMGLSAYTKAGAVLGRGLQAMSQSLRLLPEYMLVDAQRKVEAHNELSQQVAKAVDGLTPDKLTSIDEYATSDAVATVEDDVNANIDPFMLMMLHQAQHEVLDVAQAQGKTVNLGPEAKAVVAKLRMQNLAKAKGLIAEIKRLQAAKGDENQAQIARLQAQVEILTAKADTADVLAKKLAHAQVKINQLAGNIAASDKAKKLQQALNNLKSELPEVQQENLTLQGEITTLKEKIVKLGDSLKKARDGKFITKKMLEKQAKKLEGELEAKQKTLDAALASLEGDTELVSLTERYDESLKRVQELEAEIAGYDPREMLKSEMYASDATTIAKGIRNLLREGKKDTASQVLSNMPQAKRDEVTRMLLC